MLLTSGRTSRQSHPSLDLAAIRRELDDVEEILVLRRLERTVLELKYEFASLRFETAMLLYAHVCRKAGYWQGQPRWPKGSGDDSGRWSGGGGTQTPVVNNAQTGISTIDRTTETLLSKLARVVDILPKGSGPLYGIAVHTAFGTAVRFGNIPGIGIGDVEHSWGGVDSRYGSLDSVRTNVILRNEIGDPIAIYDVKTGGARLRPSRVQELREAVAPGSNIPVIEIQIERGVSVKALECTAHLLSIITAKSRRLAFEKVG